MKKTLSFLLTVLFVLAAVLPLQAGLGQSAAANLISAQMDVKYQQTEARKILSMINAFRTGGDAWYWNSTNTQKVTLTSLQPLTYDYSLEKIAMQRAAEIALSFAHTRPNGGACFSAYPDAYVYSSRGENIAAGQTSAAEVNEDWREDNESYAGQGHRRNMLGKDYTAVGVGCTYVNGIYYWVEEFSSATSNAAQTAANNGQTTVTLEIDAAALTVSDCRGTPASLQLTVGQSVALPRVSVSAKTADTWPSRCTCALTLDAIWSSTDNTVAAVEGKNVAAKRAGNAGLQTSVLGRTVQVPVAVTAPGAEPTAQTNPTQPAQTDSQTTAQQNVCKWCGGTHEGLLGTLIGLFHNILAMLLGAKY